MRKLLLMLAMIVSADAIANESCNRAADLAHDVAIWRDAKEPQSRVENVLRSQYVEDTEEQREGNATTEKVIRVAYELKDLSPEELRMVIYHRCMKGKPVKEQPASRAYE